MSAGLALHYPVVSDEVLCCTTISLQIPDEHNAAYLHIIFWCHAKYVALPNNSQYTICATCGNY